MKAAASILPSTKDPPESGRPPDSGPSLAAYTESLARDATCFIGIADADFKPCYVNDAGRKLVGLAPDADLSALSIADFFAPEDRAMIRNEVLPTLRREGAWEGNGRMHRFDGGPCAVLKWRAFLLKDADGEVIGAATITTDLCERLDAEAQLRDSRARLKAASDLVGLTSYRWDPVTGAMDWDESIKALWGLTADAEFDERLWIEGIHPDDRERVQAAVAQSVDPDGDGVYSIDYRVVGHAGGPERWISTFGRTTFEGAAAVAFTGAVLDITERKSREVRLSRSEAYLAAILHQLPMGVGVFDTAGRQVLGNTALERFMLDGLPSRDLEAAARWCAFHADGSPLPANEYPGERALRGETVLPGTDFLHIPECGSEAWMRVSAAPLRDVDDTIQGVLCMVEDVDHQHRSADQLRESEERFRRFAENSADVMWIYDIPAGRLEYLSPGFQRTWGIAPVEVLADPEAWCASLHPDDRGAWRRPDQMEATGETMTQEYRIVRPDGAVRWIRDTAFPIRNADGRVVQAGGIAQDVTPDVSPTVYLLDADEQTRESKAVLLRDAGYAVTAFESERAFLDVAGALIPGCVVATNLEADATTFELVRALRARLIELPVVIETCFRGDVGLAINGMKAGAADILEAPCDPDTLLAAVACALAGVREAEREDESTQSAHSRIALMSAREREVLEGLLSGGTNKTIARDLGISPRTVENHRARVMERLGVQTLPQAVLVAAAAGLKPARRGPDPRFA
jgi:PAS domain S-box-containing protein